MTNILCFFPGWVPAAAPLTPWQPACCHLPDTWDSVPVFAPPAAQTRAVPVPVRSQEALNSDAVQDQGRIVKP